MLLVKTLRSTTFKQALIAIGAFGMIVSALFSYVYLSTSSYVRSRSDRAIVTEYLSLQGAYERSGRDGLIALIKQRIGDKSFADNVYILADPSLAPLAGNLKAWPSTATAARGWTEFRAPESSPNATNRPLLRAMLGTFPSGGLPRAELRRLRPRQLYRSDQDGCVLGRRIAGGGCGVCKHSGDAADGGAD